MEKFLEDLIFWVYTQRIKLTLSILDKENTKRCEIDGRWLRKGLFLIKIIDGKKVGRQKIPSEVWGNLDLDFDSPVWIKKILPGRTIQVEELVSLMRATSSKKTIKELRKELDKII